MSEVTKDCSCNSCVNACKAQPGWFAPGEAERAAQFLEMPWEEFQKLIIKDTCSDRWANNAPYVWAPRKIGVDSPGSEIRESYKQRTEGPCAFLVNNKCSIHPVKPYECRRTLVCDWKPGLRDEIEKLYSAAGAPLGMRPESDDNERPSSGSWGGHW